MARKTAARVATLALAAGLAAGLAGCGGVLDALSAKRKGPDEFQVIARDPIRMPPALGTSTLPQPVPGAPSPLDPDPQAEAIAALAGVGPPSPGQRPLSRGEAALLEAADASSADPDVRSRIAAENAELEQNAPYRPPTILELFDGGPEYDAGDVLDPMAEAKRLQQEEGVPAPLNQAALAREAEMSASQEAATARRAEEPGPAPPNPRNRPNPAPLQ